MRSTSIVLLIGSSSILLTASLLLSPSLAQEQPAQTQTQAAQEQPARRRERGLETSGVFYAIAVAHQRDRDFARAFENYNRALAIEVEADKRKQAQADTGEQPAVETRTYRIGQAEILYAIGTAHQANNEFEKAIECYQKVIAMKPDSHTFYALGTINHHRRCFEDAIWNYQLSLIYFEQENRKPSERSTTKASIYYGLGSAYLALNDNDNAVEFFHKSLQAMSAEEPGDFPSEDSIRELVQTRTE